MTRRIKIDLMFEDPLQADNVWKAIKTQAASVKLKNMVNEKSFIQYEECHHDELPPKPCVILQRIEA